MSSVIILDTSVFLNILNVPGRNQQKNQVFQDFAQYIEMACTFILPMATVLETGNHIAQNGDGRTRRQVAQKFCEAVSESFHGNAPYQTSDFPKNKEVMEWLNKFPDLAGQNKSETRRGEGTSLGDLSIIEEFNTCKSRFPMTEIFIWSLDADLTAYHYQPN
ncbi:hypothetical protein [Oceanobacter antarcticus]|uniref:PIN domain-containing protein n=1 Tax=Oceanobacter antarcticus TaxID=3133425 RepID=A0ABW8NHB9_9GAMM